MRRKACVPWSRAGGPLRIFEPRRKPGGVGPRVRRLTGERDGLEAGCDLLDLGQRNVWRLEQGAEPVALGENALCLLDDDPRLEGMRKLVALRIKSLDELSKLVDVQAGQVGLAHASHGTPLGSFGWGRSRCTAIR